MRWRTLLLTVLWIVGAPLAARADAPPSDVSLAQFEATALGPAPEGYLERREREVRWEYPAMAASLIEPLVETVHREWPRLERELGVDIDDELLIRVGTNPEEMAALAPVHAPPPAYAVGVAYPASGLILLTLSAPETWERPDLPQVLTHELSHVALHRAVNGHPVPRWLTEGLAIYQARERSLERTQTLWEATVRGQLIALDDLSRGFPRRPHEVSIAYAESADFVEWMIEQDPEGRRFGELIRRIADGQPFETAVSQTFSRGIGQLEFVWRAELTERYGAFPLLFGTGVIWFGIAILMITAWFRRRADSRRILERWDRDEEGRDEQHEAVFPPKAPRELPTASESSPEEADAEFTHPPPDVPTVVWDGRSHTLH